MASKFYNLDIDQTLGGEESKDYVISSQKATKTYIDNQIKNKADKSVVDEIVGKIPAEASAENQLADKAYVDSKASGTTITFRKYSDEEA